MRLAYVVYWRVIVLLPEGESSGGADCAWLHRTRYLRCRAASIHPPRYIERKDILGHLLSFVVLSGSLYNIPRSLSLIYLLCTTRLFSSCLHED